MPRPVAVDDVGNRGTEAPFRNLGEELTGPSGPILVHPDDRAEVGAGGPQQFVAILAWAGERALVGQDPGAWPERLEPEARKEAALNAFGVGSREPVDLLVNVDRGSRVLVERPVGAPRGQRSGARPARGPRRARDAGELSPRGRRRGPPHRAPPRPAPRPPGPPRARRPRRPRPASARGPPRRRAPPTRTPEAAPPLGCRT